MKNRSAFVAAFAAYLSWGFFPIYWKFLSSVSSVEILCHRIIWSCLFYALLWFWFDRHRGFWPSALRDWCLCLAASLLISSNWLAYIYAVNNGHILDGSLAYFINPLLNMAIGFLFFKEKMSPLQILAIVLAGVGVMVLTLSGPGVPWLALFLATTFALYGVTKKMLRLSPFHSAFLEGLFVLLPALVMAFVLRHQSAEPMAPVIFFLLIGGGVVTGLPLVWFAQAAQGLPYSTMGFMQFLSPSLQFLVGVFLYGEAFTPPHQVAFTLIWAAALLYVASIMRKRRKARAAQ